VEVIQYFPLVFLPFLSLVVVLVLQPSFFLPSLEQQELV
jgi:hypothetical protein